jgi:acyl-CoA thioesterase
LRFAEATAVDRIDDHIWQAEVQPDWGIFGITNGGYLMAIAARAMSQAADGRLPVTLTSHFIRPVSAGPARITTETIKTGKTFSTVEARLAVEADALSLLGSFAVQGRARPETTYMSGAPPDLPPPEECVLAVPAVDGPLPPPLVAQFEQRLHPDDAAALMGEATGVARVRGWFRLLDDEPFDPFVPLLAADAFPPAIFNLEMPMGWTPTLEMTTHVRARPETQWLLCQFTTRFVTGGFLEEDGEIWDQSGRLVALSRQMALVAR